MSPPPPRRILQQRWSCDVCHVKWFLDFDQACRHEVRCANEQQRRYKEYTNVIKTSIDVRSNQVTTDTPHNDDATLSFFGSKSPRTSNVAHDLFSSSFHPNPNPTHLSTLWTDRHSIATTKDLLGPSNLGTLHKMARFLSDWKHRRSRTHYDSDSTYSDPISSVFVVIGPCGSGKTRLVRVLAREEGCHVMEINSTEPRGGGALKRRIMESTCSHSVRRRQLVENKTDGNKRVRVSPLEEDWCDDDYDDETEEEDVKEESSSASMNVILIDEADLLFHNHGDAGFWSTLSQLAKSSKSPIFLTAHSLPRELSQYQHGELTRPTVDECQTLLERVAKEEGMGVRDSRGVELLAEWFKCDVRRMMNGMQLYCASRMERGRREVRLEPEGSMAMECGEGPVMVGVDPMVVPHDQYTVISIRGKNFCGSTLYLGGSVAQFRVVSDSQIFAVCPPLILPEGVSAGLLYQQSEPVVYCLSSKFVQVVVRGRGIVSDGARSWNIEYNVPLEGSVREREISRKEFVRRAKARRQRFENEKMIEEGFLSSEEEFEFEFEVNRGHPRRKIEDDSEGDGEVGFGELTESTTLNDSNEVKSVDPAVLLDKAMAELSDIEPILTSTISNCDNPSSSLDELSTLADQVGRLSDIALLEENLLSVPMLGGAMQGLGSQPIGDIFSESDPSVDKLCNDKRKPPSFEALHLSANEFFYGASDSHMTHPNRRRDRFLLSNALHHSRGLGSLDNFERESSEKECSPQYEDDLLLCPQVPGTLLLLPFLLGKVNRDTEVLREAIDNETALLERRRGDRASRALSIVATILLPPNSDEVEWTKTCFGLRHCDRFTDESARKAVALAYDCELGHELALDYLPFLRIMADYETKAINVLQDAMPDNGESKRLRSSKRRRQYIRENYLDGLCGRHGMREHRHYDLMELGRACLGQT